MTGGARLRWTGVALVAVVLSIAVAALLSAGGRPAPATDGIVGRAAPPFDLPDLADPARTRTPGELLGQVWLLNFWASWCGPCREEHALLLEISRQGGAPILGLNTLDDPRAAQEWLLRLGDPYVTTAVDRDGAAGSAYGVPGLPVTFVVDRKGIVRHRHVGAVTQQLWERELRPLVRRLQGAGA